MRSSAGGGTKPKVASLVDEPDLRERDGDRPGRRASSCRLPASVLPPVYGVSPGVARRADAEQSAAGRSPASRASGRPPTRSLERAEAFHPRVRLAENAQAEHPDDDEQRRDREERDEQLRPHLRRRAGDQRTSRFVAPSAASLRGTARHEQLRAAMRRYGLSVAVDPAEFVISHLPLIFCTCGDARRPRRTFPSSRRCSGTRSRASPCRRSRSS